MAKSAVGSMSDWSGVLKDFFRQIHDGSHTLDAVKAFNDHRNPFEMGANLTTDWQDFYRKFFGLELDFSSVRIPERQPGFDRLIIVAQGLTPNQVYEACQHNFDCWRYINDLDAVTKNFNEREPIQHYAIWVRNQQEADEELKNLSANQIKERGLTTETLLERLLHELKYWGETNEHLDVNNVTLCAGSRTSRGSAPGVYWGGGGLDVHWYSLANSGSSLRAREAVS